MANETQPAAVPAVVPENIGKFILVPLEHSIAAGARKALESGVPAHLMIEMFINHLASVVAMVEPPGARTACIQDVVAQFSGLVRQHVDRRYTTLGGIVRPEAGA